MLPFNPIAHESVRRIQKASRRLEKRRQPLLMSRELDVDTWRQIRTRG